MKVFEQFDKIAHTAFAELVGAATKEEKDAVREKMLRGEYRKQILALRDEMEPDISLERFDALADYFARCADDEQLISSWDILA